MHFYPGRRTPAKGVHISFGSPNICWCTICTKERREWLTQPWAMQRLVEIWKSDATHWLVGDFLLMPDHMHFFCAPVVLTCSIEKWFSFWKHEFTKSHHHSDWEWLRGGFHTRVRSEELYREKWHYMMENPLRKGFVQNVEDWPWRGTVHPIQFRPE